MKKQDIQDLLKDLELLKNKKHVDKNIINLFIQRINKGRVTKKDNNKNHICAFFLPIHTKTKSIYLVEHKKANDWLPPGGHIEKGESIIETIKREFSEELSHILTDEKIEFFDLSIKQINNPKFTCKTHYDLWHLIYIDRFPFKYCRHEFYNASWMKIDRAIKKMKHKNFRAVVEKLSKYI